MGIDSELIQGDFKSDVFNCAVCQELLEDPVMLQACQHYFCRRCIAGLVVGAGWGGGSAQCPECRKEFTPDKIKKPFLFMTPFLGGTLLIGRPGFPAEG